MKLFESPVLPLTGNNLVLVSVKRDTRTTPTVTLVRGVVAVDAIK